MLRYSRKNIFVLIVIILIAELLFLIVGMYIIARKDTIVYMYYMYIGRVGDTDIANWKTYRSEEYGFEIKYPKNWTAEERFSIKGDKERDLEYWLYISHRLNTRKVDIDGEVSITFFNTDDNNNFFEKELDILRKEYSSNGTIVSDILRKEYSISQHYEEITIDGVKGFMGVKNYQAQRKYMNMRYLFPDKNNNGIFIIIVLTKDSLDKELYQEPTKLIVSTFRFLDN